MGRGLAVVAILLVSLSTTAAPGAPQDRVRTSPGIQAANVRQSPQGNATVIGQATSNNDHIICVTAPTLDCNFTTVIDGGGTPTWSIK